MAIPSRWPMPSENPPAPVIVSLSLMLTLMAVLPTAPPEKPMDFREVVPMPVVLTTNDEACRTIAWRARK